MLSVTITEKEGLSTTTTFDKTEVLIGRVKGNDVVLPKSNISKRHSRIVVKDGKIILIDLKSTNGTFVNGEKINGPHVMQEGDKIFIGDFTIEVHETGGAPAMSAAPGPMGMQPGMSQFGGPSAASLPSIGSDPQHAGMSGLGAAGRAPAFNRPSMPASNMNAPAAMGPGAMGPAAMGQAPSAAMGPGVMGPAPMNPVAMGPGAMGPSAMGPAAMGPSAMGPSAMGPASMNPAAPMGPASMAGAPAVGPMAPSLGAPMMGPSSLGASPEIGAVGQSSPAMNPAPINAVSAPSLGASPMGPAAAASPLPGSRPLAGASPLKQSAISAPAAEGVVDKAIRLPGSSQSERNSAKAGSRAHGNLKDISTAALPEEIVVEDARTPESDAWIKAARIVMDKYLAANDFQTIAAIPYPPEPETQDACYAQLMECLNATRTQLGNVDPEMLVDFLLKEACGLGAVDSLIDDAEVSAFNVYNFETIVVERKGHREISSLQFTSADTLYLVAQRLLAFIGLTPQNAPAVSEVRFGDGTQLEVVMPPVSVASTSIVVRKPSHEFLALNALAQHEMLSPDMAKFLNLCVKARRNILIVGAQTSGRTTLLNALGAEIPDGERIVTVENSAVLVMPQLYVMNLEAQNAAFGQGGDLASLIRQAGRLRAERVLADSILSPADASAFAAAVCSGAQGSIATMSGLSAKEGFELYKRMLASNSDTEKLAGNIDIVISVRAFTDARRRIVEIAEVVRENDEYRLAPIFVWNGAGMGAMAMGDGQFKAVGTIPEFYRELERGGMALDPSIFNP